MWTEEASPLTSQLSQHTQNQPNFHKSLYPQLQRTPIYLTFLIFSLVAM